MPSKAKAADAGARQRLIEATAQIMREEGYAAATSRRVAAAAGVKQALVYYYFPTMDDLYVEVLRAGAEASLQRMRAALTDSDPLRALWSMNSDLRLTGLNTEFMALANHRKAIRKELKAYAERVRDIETAAVTVALRARGVDLDEYPPVQRERRRGPPGPRRAARVHGTSVGSSRGRTSRREIHDGGPGLGAGRRRLVAIRRSRRAPRRK